ncbi:MAG: heparinase II/III family protein [Planctomycetota bacterium]
MYKSSLSAIVVGLLSSMAGSAILEMGKASPFYDNLATPDHGTKISSPADLSPGYDLRSIIDPKKYPGDLRDGFCQFADTDQHEMFTIDLGRVLAGGLAIIRTHPGYGSVHGDPDNRRPRQIVVGVSAKGNEGSWRTVRSYLGKENVPRRFSIVWDDEPVRYLRFDLGRNSDKIGSRMSDVRIFPRYRLLPLAERLGDIDKLLKPDIAELKPFRWAVAAKDYRKAAAGLRRHFGNNRFKVKTVAPKASYPSDEWAKNIVSFNERSWKIPGNRFDWYFFPCDLSHEPPSYWIAGRQFWYLANYYKHTKDKKYIGYAEQMISQWITDVPCPGVHCLPDRGGCMLVGGWPAIRAANRTYGLSAAVVTFAPHRQEFDDDTWVELLYSIWEHAEFLAEVAPQLGGNWLTWADERLIRTAKAFPEFRHQPSWLQVGHKSFEKVVLEDVSDDGKECEDTTYYCLRAIREIVSMYESFTEAGIELSPKVESRVRKALDFPAWIHQPDFRDPGIGDMGMYGEPRKAIRLVDRYAAKWGRKDLVYINTRGREGIKPAESSRAFLRDGWFIMRSDWDDGLAARHLIFRAPPGGCRGHGHRDLLAIVLYAHGRGLLIDPGMTLYGIKNSDKYCLTDMHNTVEVDEEPQPHGPGWINGWESTPVYDYADAMHRVYRRITHRRQVIFAKPDYYVVIDDLTGGGEKTLDWNYHFLKGAEPSQSGGIIRTNFPEGGNLAILALPQDIVSASSSKSFNYVTTEVSGGKEVPSTGWLIRVRDLLPKRLVTVLFPFSGSRMSDDLKADLPQPNVLTVQHDGQIDVVAWRPKGGKDTWTLEHAGIYEQVDTNAVVIRINKKK